MPPTTIGIMLVACLAARAGDVLITTMTVNLEPNRRRVSSLVVCRSRRTLVRSGSRSGCSARSTLVQKNLGLQQIGCTESLREAVIERGKQALAVT